MSGSRFQFDASQPYQLDAIASVVDLFDGQPKDAEKLVTTLRGATVLPDSDQTELEIDLTQRNCQYLWIGVFQATSVSVDSAGSGGVMSAGRSSSLPLWKTAPARTRATRWGALTARHRACAASISL